VRACLFYLFTQAAYGIYLPFINVYFVQERGLGGQQIGLLAAVAPLLTLLVAPVWAIAADAQGSRLRLLRWAMAGAGMSVVLIGLPAQIGLILLAVAFFTLFQVAIVPLGDGVIASHVAERGGAYGRVRLFGSIGFALGGLLLGWLGGRFSLQSIFPAYAVVMLVGLAVTGQLVDREPPPPPRKGGWGLAVVKDRALLGFLLVAGVAAVGISAGYYFVYVFLGELGAEPSLMGRVSAIGAMAEVPLMLYSGRLIRRYGAPPIFALGMALMGVGWWQYSCLVDPDLAKWVQLLNGAGMGLLWPAGVTFVAQHAPAGRGATAQSLLSAVMFGIAPLLASQGAGWLFDAAGARTVLRGSGGSMAVGLVILAVLWQTLKRPQLAAG